MIFSIRRATIAALAALICAASAFSLLAWASTEPVAQDAAAPAQQPVDAGGDASLLAASSTLTANCRYGLTGQSPWTDWIVTQNTGVGWYLDFNVRYNYDAMPGAEYAQVIRIKQDRNIVTGYYSPTYTVYPALADNGLGAFIASAPGALWIVGNEPDRGPLVPTDTDRVQDDTFPDVYAAAYHDVYQYIKSHDARAQVAVAGLVEVTPGRLNYLDQVWQAYQTRYGATMPVDVWNMHLYVLPETDHSGTQAFGSASVAKGTPLSLGKREGLSLQFDAAAQQFCSNSLYYCWAQHDNIDEFKAQVIAMRTWMKANGQQNKPLILTEFGILWGDDRVAWPNNPYNCWVVDEYGHCYTPERAAQFLDRSFNYLNTAQDAGIGYPMDGNRLVQQWMWFHMNNGVNGLGHVSNIVTATAPYTFAPAGRTFMADVTNPISFPQSINLLASSTRGLGSLPGGGSNNVQVSVGVMNNGSIAPSAPVSVEVYADLGRTQPLGSATVRGVRGCARQEYPTVVNFSLPLTYTGMFSYYVRVDPGNLAGETTMSDNDTQGVVFIGSNFLWLPVIRR
ncbi:MAG: hypothetical protein HZB53_12375 [Chloroflexi bacterium]|nr:hypothetical protein [Chloroflexota bacterium]